MASVKLSVIFYSATGANHQLARWAAGTAEETGAEVRLRKVAETAPQEAIDANPAWKENVKAMESVQEATLEDLEWADVYIFCMPTRYGGVPAQLKAFIDTTGSLWQQGKLADKVVSAMATASNPHGGQEATILGLYTQLMHWGCIIAAPGYTDPVTFKSGGNPYGMSATVDEKGNIKDDIKSGVAFQVKRTLSIAEKLAR